MVPPIDVGKVYRIAGRPPIWIKQIRYGTGKRISVVGYTITNYKKYMKFHTYNKDTLRSLADEEGITEIPPTVEFRFNSTSKVQRVDTKRGKYAIGEAIMLMPEDKLRDYLNKPRKAL